MTSAAWLSIPIGLVSGLLSGMFGVGGGLITTPAIRLLLGGSAISAIATPLPVIIPTALAGGISHARTGHADVRGGLIIGGSGAAGAVLGALLAGWIGGSILLLVTAVLIGYVAIDMIVFSIRNDSRPEGMDGPCLEALERKQAEEEAEAATGGAAGAGDGHRSRRQFVLIGVIAGLYSGLLGLGGGFVIVPLLTRWMKLSMKRAVGTSLVAVAVLAVPGSITHGLLGHVDWPLALMLSVGVVPGALIGARVTQVASERFVRIGFAALLLVFGGVLAANELGLI